MKWIIVVFTILMLIFTAGLGLIRLKFSSARFDPLDRQLGRLVADMVEGDGSIRNCVLSVAKGNGSFAWSGAAGTARQENQLPMTKDTPIFIASVTKLYTAAVIMRLYEKGALSLNDPMARYLPQRLVRGILVYHGRDYSGDVTIGQLLSHTSGIADYYTEKPKGGKSLFELFMEKPERSWTVDETIERARMDLKANFRPGAAASYSDTNFQLLGKIIEAVTSKPLAVVYDEFIFCPLGLKHTWLVGRSAPEHTPAVAPADVFYKDVNITRIRSNGAYWADGGIVSTAEEMITFLKALNQGRIVSEETLKLMHHWHHLQFPFQYGYGTMYFKLPWIIDKVLDIPPLWGHSGSTGSFLYYSEDLDLYMAGTIDQADARSKPFRLMLRVIGAVYPGSQGTP